MLTSITLSSFLSAPLYGAGEGDRQQEPQVHMSSAVYKLARQQVLSARAQNALAL